MLFYSLIRTQDDRASTRASRTTGPHHFAGRQVSSETHQCRCAADKIVTPIAADAVACATRSLTPDSSPCRQVSRL